MNKRTIFPFFPNLERDCSQSFAPDEDGVAVTSDLDRDGRELPDPVPMAPPVGMMERPSLADFVHRMIRQEVSRAARAAEMETFDEADDFDIEDDPVDEATPYEKVFDPVKVGDDWPMYYNPANGLYGQLPPNEVAPEGFVRLEPERRLPKGWAMPASSVRGEGGAEPPTGKPTAAPSKGADSPPDKPTT